MSEERIIIEIDDTQLDVAIAKLQQAITLSTTALGTPSAKIGAESLMGKLPTINRELRLILSQVPGLRTAISLYYRLRRLARGIDIGGFQLYITIIATAILLLKFIIDRQRRIERRQQQYEVFIRRQRGLTHDQYVDLMDTWQSYFRSSPG